MRLGLHLTDRCNLNCGHCLRDPAAVPNDLDVSVVERALDQVASYGPVIVALTGGEPFLHPNVVDIVDAISARGLRWRAVTNGSRVETLARVLEAPSRRHAVDHVTLSLDGSRAETHDDLRGSGSFDEVLCAVVLFTSLDVPFVLQLVVHSQNETELETYGLLASELGAQAVRFALFQPTGTHRDAELGLPRRAWTTVQARIDRLAGILRIPVERAEGFPTEHRLHACSPWRSESLHVNVHGKASLCCQLSDTPGGNLSDELADLVSESLVDGHLKALTLVHELQRRRLQAIAAGTLGPWDELPCNWCQKQFGKPHWTEDGVGGAAADRERWRGAWAGGATGRVRLPIVDAPRADLTRPR